MKIGLWFVIGTILGSFFLVIGTRLPKKEDAFFSRSRCDHCHRTLKWYNLIPLFSYLFQRGRCAFCKEKISSDHFWVELFTGILFMICAIKFPLGYHFYVSLIICSLLIIIFVSDFKYMIILDSPLIIASILIIALKFIYLGFDKTIFSIFAGIVMFLSMLIVERGGKAIFKKEVLGGGDIKLSFLMGLVLNIRLGMVALVLSTFLALPYALASVYLKKDHEFPYGPFLAGALFIVFFFYDKFELLFTLLFSF